MIIYKTLFYLEYVYEYPCKTVINSNIMIGGLIEANRKSVEIMFFFSFIVTYSMNKRWTHLMLVLIINDL